MNPLEAVEGVAKFGMDIRTKMILALGGFILLLLGAWYIYDLGVNDGTMKERGVWNGKEVQRKQAELALTLKHNAEMDALALKHQRIERETSEEHEKQLAVLRVERNAARADADRRGGLRIPAPNCAGASRTETSSQAASPSGRDEAFAGTIRLPKAIENDLWSIVDDADEIVEQARACQAWIRKSGFYGPVVEVPTPVVPPSG